MIFVGANNPYQPFSLGIDEDIGKSILNGLMIGMGIF